MSQGCWSHLKLGTEPVQANQAGVKGGWVSQQGAGLPEAHGHRQGWACQRPPGTKELTGQSTLQ